MNTNLTKAERLIMKCIWDEPKDIVLSEVVVMMNERYGKEWAPQTVSTYLSSLVKKDYLKMTRNGKIYTYHPQVEAKDYFKKEFMEFVEFWGEFTVSDFLIVYLKNNKLDTLEIDRLKELVG